MATYTIRGTSHNIVYTYKTIDGKRKQQWESYCFWFSSTASISCYSAACNSTSWWITRSRRSSTLS